MRFFEYEAKEIFRRYGVETPCGEVVSTPREARIVAEGLQGRVVVKAQVLSGGRGKAGGIRFAENLGDVWTVAEECLGLEIGGEKAEKLLVEEELDVCRELYLAIVVDKSRGKIIALASAKGGVNVEEAYLRGREGMVSLDVDVFQGLKSPMAVKLGKKIGLRSGLQPEFGRILGCLYRVFKDYEAELVEVNPLVLTKDRRLVAADAKLVLDDDALFRHPDLKPFAEAKSRGLGSQRSVGGRGLCYVSLDGDIGVIGNGAGLVMATIDLIGTYGGSAANFLDIGGGGGPEVVREAVEIALSQEIRVLLVNIFAGISRCDEVAAGIVSALKSRKAVTPLVVRLTGVNEDEGRRILGEAGIKSESSMEEAVKMAVELAGALHSDASCQRHSR